MSLNLAHVLETQARSVGQRIALAGDGFEVTYAQLNAEANQIAAGLSSAGFGPGDRIALCCPTTPQFIACYFAILKLGAVVVPINTLLRARELAQQLQCAEAAAMLCHLDTPTLPIATTALEAVRACGTCGAVWTISSPLSAGMEPPAGIPTLEDLKAGQPTDFESHGCSADDASCIVFTSGTTGEARGAELTHANMMIHWLLVRDILHYTPEDRVLVAAPMYHVLAQSLLMGPTFTVGGTLVLLPRFEPAQVLRTMEEFRITFFTGVPSMYLAMLSQPDIPHSIIEATRRHWTRGLVGGAPVPPSLLQRVTDRFGPRMLIGYGLSETTVLASIHRLEVQCPAESVGLPLLGVEVRVVDPETNPVPQGELGEIVVRGHNVMKGYINRPEANAAAFRGGWFHTGDVGKFDEQGFLHVVDRIKDIIIRGGRKICPREVEDVLIQHPAVQMCAVVGAPHEELGEEILAYVVAEVESPAVEELIAWSRERLASYCYPRRVEFVDSLPLGPTGKVLRNELRKRAREGAAA